MRFRSRARAWAAAALFAVPAALASPQAAREEIAARLRAQLPGVPAADYVLGAAAFDPALRQAREAPDPATGGILAAGKQLWERKFRNGRSLASCFPNGGRRVAARYPLYDSRVKRVVTLEMAINQCLKTHNEPLLDLDNPAAMGTVTAYLRSLSDEQKVAVRVPAAAQSRFEEGRRLYFTRMGQRNFACASCHVQGAGRFFGEVPLSPAIGQATHWPAIRDGKPLTLHQRMRQCLELMGAAPFPLGSDELNHLEYFLSYLSNGLPLRANVTR